MENDPAEAGRTMKISPLYTFLGVGLLIFSFVLITNALHHKNFSNIRSNSEFELGIGTVNNIEFSTPVGLQSYPGNNHINVEIPAQESGDGSAPRLPLAVSAASLDNPSRIIDLQQADLGWNPPTLSNPTALHPYDHFWLLRPVYSKDINYSLPYYHFGTDGPENSYRLHHGVDLSNPVGIEVRAAGDGTVIWADKGHFNEHEAITSYGNVIVIQHDFGYRGQDIYTLYAHLNEFFVTPGQTVNAGELIGTIGQTGNVTGPHVHFEVRINRNFYYDVRNPELWMAPYVNTGVVLGRLETSFGETIYDADVELIDPIKGYSIAETSTYSGSGVKPDDLWQENFVFANIKEGYYLVHAYYNDEFWSGAVQVIAGMSNWVDLTPSLITSSPSE